ncbi:MAG: hypothetical protein LUQ69_02760 [Methanoregulaceae archaeon]|nr:hypothetical protein [Methanoregulaceae archaeon]
MMDNELREKAKNEMRLILEAAGYTVSDVDDPLDLSAIREGGCLLVLCSNDEDAIAGFNKTNYNLKTEGGEIGCKKLLFTLNDPVKADHCVIWGPGEFVRYAGEAVLARMLDRELSIAFEGAPSGISPAREEQMPSGVSIPHLPIKVNKQQAERIAGTQGTMNLRFMPHWVYHFVSSGEQVYKDHHIPFDAEGWGAINAINGMKVEIDAKAVDNSEVPGDAELLKPHLSKDEATEKIFGEVIEQLTQHVRIKQAKGDAIYYEEKVMKPDKKNISVEIGEIYIPVWQIRGKKIVEVNAFTGETLSQPMDEGVEIL